MAQLSCENRVIDALDEWLCEGKTTLQVEAVFKALLPLLDDRAHVNIVKNTWLTLLREYDHGGIMAWLVENTILAAAMKNGWWRSFLESPEDARVLAMLVVRYIERGGSKNRTMPICDDEAAGAFKEPLQLMLRDWLKPVRVSDKLTRRAFAGALFGEAWCMLVLDSYPAGVSIALAIEQSQPPLLPNRVAVCKSPVGETLPVLEC